jgi:hypothetical protein
MQPFVGDRHPGNLPRSPKKSAPAPSPDVRVPPEANRPEAPQAEEAPLRPKREVKPVDRLT